METTTPPEAETYLMESDEKSGVYVGVDEGMRVRVTEELLAEERPDLTLAHQIEHEDYSSWAEEDYVEYTRWLIVGILQYDPEEDRPPFQEFLHRAAVLRLGPNLHDFRDAGLLMSDLQKALGFRPHMRDRESAYDPRELVLDGTQYVQRLEKRLTKTVIDEIAATGDLASHATIDRIFGVKNFQEIIGCPSFRNSTADDLADWGAAFIFQNPHLEFLKKHVKVLSRKGRGPGGKIIDHVFEDFNEFRTASVNRHAELASGSVTNTHKRPEIVQRHLPDTDTSDTSLNDRYAALEQEIEAGHLPIRMVLGSDEKRQHLRNRALFKMGTVIAGPTKMRRMTWITARSTERALDALRKLRTPPLSNDQLRDIAAANGVADDIWLAYRYNNVSLYIPPEAA